MALAVSQLAPVCRNFQADGAAFKVALPRSILDETQQISSSPMSALVPFAVPTKTEVRSEAVPEEDDSLETDQIDGKRFHNIEKGSDR
jgi:hypothetical protein